LEKIIFRVTVEFRRGAPNKNGPAGQWSRHTFYLESAVLNC
jgi:hypothetical protein